MSTERKIPGRFLKLYERLKKLKIPYRLTFFIIGIASTAWFLVRVIPKPSRAGYPCMKIAAPFMSSFVLYLLSLTGSALLFKRARRFFYRSRYLLAGAAFLGALVVLAISSNLFTFNARAADGTDPEDFIANQPVGEGVGIFPGRVVWAWDPDATDENCTNEMNDPVRGEDGYFLAKNNNQEVIDRMLGDVVKKLTGSYTVASAWDSLFTDFNKRKDHGEVSYQAGEKIFIKINQGGADWLTNRGPDDDLSFMMLPWTEVYYGMAETSPAIVISLLDQLVNEAGVAQEDIYVGDPKAHIYKYNYDQMVAAFPDVKYVDRDPNHEDIGRTIITPSADPVIHWSDKGEVMHNAVIDYLYAEMENAEYLINVAALKAHARAGITLTAKNHFGSHTRADAEHLHPGLVAPENDQPIRTQYGMYRVLTDIMGHEKLGGNTVLFLVDGLWGGTEAVEKPVKWNSAPFDGDWPNSIFGAQDQVALESVCFDFLRTEFTNPSGPGRARPWMGAVDDYLHQAADSVFWPEGIIYDPEGDGTPIGSLGVHEHWNNAAEKQYSRNMGYDVGIELVCTDASLVDDAVMAREAATAPVVDGEATDPCWEEAQWYSIDQTWITWGESIDSSDFFGRFKVCWSDAENLLYYYVEITDDAFVDGYVFPGDGYPDFDIVEVFLDEDHSGGLHVFDDNPELGENSENAFSYHLAVDAPADEGVNHEFVACDIDGTSWADRITINYANHFPELSMKKTGNIYHYEFSLKVYDDTYDDSDPEASRADLFEGKEMGMSMAYCDNDQQDGQRDNFFGSVWVPEEAYNDHWMNADWYGTIRLVKTGTAMNHAVQLTGSIPDFVVTQVETDLVIQSNLLEVFFDPDGDTLEYTVHCDDPLLTFSTEGHVLSVNAAEGFSGETDVEVVASDGEFQVSDVFTVSANLTGISPERIAGGVVQCYPNPFTGTLHITIERNGITPGTVITEVYNLGGQRILLHGPDRISGPLHMVSLDLTGQPAGAYIVKVRWDGCQRSMIVHKH
jgi:hypothetical protein